MSDDMCLDAASPQGPVKIVRCHGMGGNQAWVYNDEVKAREESILLYTIRESILLYTWRAPFFFFSDQND